MIMMMMILPMTISFNLEEMVFLCLELSVVFDVMKIPVWRCTVATAASVCLHVIIH